MLLRLAFVPPDSAIEGLRALGSRLAAERPGVHPVPPGLIDVPIAALGNVMDRDAKRLEDAMEEHLRLPGALHVEDAGCEQRDNGDIVLRLGGDVAGLAEAARRIGKAAERVHLYIDRRNFQPGVLTATTDEKRACSPLDRVLADIAAEAGAWTGLRWAVDDVALIRTRWVAGSPQSEIVGWVPLVAG
ncbi:hypothetical protein GCM10022237_35930 [Nocardioides ginsengisoli]|uniref:2'-5' RNA ligase family protein n=1 Tax=Nocardioides ginsengisoli TaxID=363868 RepID=A0ABW3VZJ0_9ACTN